MKILTTSRASRAAAAVGLLSILPSSWAAITGTTGNVSVVPAPASVAAGAVENNTTIGAFDERQRRVLTQPLSLDITAVGNYNAGNPGLTPGTVPAGTTINSHFLHADIIGAGPITLNGTITFDQPILGIEIIDASLDATDNPLGANGTTYATGTPDRGLDFPSGDQIALLPGRRDIQISYDVFSVADQIRVITAADPTPPGMTFSMDFQGPSRGVAGPWGIPVFEGDILTPSARPPLGPWRPELLPPTPPGPVIRSASGPGFDLGLVPGPAGITEVDALSYGRDSGTRLRFSVDEWAIGLGGAVNGVIDEQTLPFPVAEAAADTFTYLSDIFAPTLAGNVIFTDGNGDTRPGVGLIEPNIAGAGQPDSGDNLDAVDMQTVAQQLTGPVFVSLDSAFTDPLEGNLANSGTAQANGFVGGDVIVITDTVFGPSPNLFISANQLGLDRVQNTERDSDDLDALVLNQNGDGVWAPEVGDFSDGSDWILFSVRRGSAVIGRPDSRLGIPIDAGDVLTIPVPGGSPFPAIVVRAEALGLQSFREDPLCGTTAQMDVSAGCDEVDALDTYESANLDTDGDGFFDDVDNCVIVANPGQFDADGDGYGNRCDPDFDNDCVVSFPDLGLFRTAIFSGNPLFDLNADGVVNFADLGILRTLFFQPPGPGLGICP